MSLHPEDLFRVQKLRHAEMIAQCQLERRARAARPPKRGLRDVGHRARVYVFSHPWWRSISTLFTGHSHPMPKPAARRAEPTTQNEARQAAVGVPLSGSNRTR
jgi:hypothetical protein